MSEHMTIADLISQLKYFERRHGGDTQVVIRKSTGWTGMGTYYFDMDLVAVPASQDDGGLHDGVWYATMEDDYEAQRTEMLKGQVPSVKVLAIWMSDYDTTNIHPDEIPHCHTTKIPKGDE